MRLSKIKIKSYYREKLKAAHKNINNLDSEGIAKALDCVSDYYHYLAEAGIPYARLALDVIEDHGRFGKLANIHLKSQSIFEGIPPEEMLTVRNKIIICLASHDAKMRGSKNYNQSSPYYEKIEDYHIKVFKFHTSPYAWGGLASKELIGSGSWMQFYEDGSGIFKGIEEIIKQDKTGDRLEYSAERMLKSVAHSYSQFSLGTSSPFKLQISTASKEQAALIWKMDTDRISEIKDDTSMLDSVTSKTFKAVAADHFVPSGENDYSSSDSENEEEYSETLLANKFINQQVSELLSSSSNLKQYRQKHLEEAMQDLELAENIVPGITKTSLESMREHSGFMQKLVGNRDSRAELEKIRKSEQEESEIMPVMKNLVQAIKNQESYEVQMPEEENEAPDWLNDILSKTQVALNQAYDDPDMQQFLSTLGNTNFEDTM